MTSRKKYAKSQEIIWKAVDNIFKKYDENNNNYIDLPQFQKMIDDLNLDSAKLPSSQELSKIFQMLDVNGDGFISRQQFYSAFSSIKGSLQ